MKNTNRSLSLLAAIFVAAPILPAHASLTVNGVTATAGSSSSSVGANWFYNASNLLYLLNAGPYVISGDDAAVSIIADADCTVDLDGVTIGSASTSYSAFVCNGRTVTFRLISRDNTFRGGDSGDGFAAIHVDSAATLVFTNLTVYGSLTAKGGCASAGIGLGGNDDDAATCGTVRFYGGSVTASGGVYEGAFANKAGAGIGGGDYGNGGAVEVYGGTINATGAYRAAGIGGGYAGNGGTVRIFGGTVAAVGGTEGAGIGGGCKYYGNGAAGGTIVISGGSVYAVGNSDAADLGHGSGGDAGAVTVTGGSVHAVNGSTDTVKNGESSTVYCVTVTGLVANAAITNFAVENAIFPAIPAYGLHDANVDANGNAYFWIPNGIRWLVVNDLTVWCKVADAGTVATPFLADTSVTVNGVACTVGSGGSGETAWTYTTDREGGLLSLAGAGPYLISGSAAYLTIVPLTDSILIASDLNINHYLTSPFDIGGHSVTLLLHHSNSFIGHEAVNEPGVPGIRIPAGTGCLAISNVAEHASLLAQGSGPSSGIGGGRAEGGGIIVVNGGDITAQSGRYGAGIGGGGQSYEYETYDQAYGAAGGILIVNGGTVTARGSNYAAGIGGGIGGPYQEGMTRYGGAGGTVIVNGGTVNATGGDGDSTYKGGAGIGAGGGDAPGLGGNVTVNGGTVSARPGTYGVSGIGGPSAGGTVTISNGVVNSSINCYWFVMEGGVLNSATCNAISSTIVNGGAINGGELACGDLLHLGAFAINGGTVTVGSLSFANQLATMTGGRVAVTNDQVLLGKIEISGGTLAVNNPNCTSRGDPDLSSYEVGCVVHGGSIHPAHADVEDSNYFFATTNKSRDAANVLYYVPVWGFVPGAPVTSITGLPAGYGLHDVYADAKGYVYVWLPAGEYCLAPHPSAGVAMGTVQYVHLDAASDGYKDLPDDLTNLPVVVTGFVPGGAITNWTPKALLPDSIETLYATNLVTRAEWVANPPVEMTNDAPAVFMKLRVR